MKCQILFYGKSKKYIINLSSAEFGQRVVKVKMCNSSNTLDKGFDKRYQVNILLISHKYIHDVCCEYS